MDYTRFFLDRNKKDEVIENIVKILSRYINIDVVYLYGTFLENNEFEDIDIALLISDERLSAYEKFNFQMGIEGEIERSLETRIPIDVKFLNFSPISFKYNIIKNGVLVFVRDEVRRIRFEKCVLSEFLDYKDILEWFDREFLLSI